jgi:hypothetical protein
VSGQVGSLWIRLGIIDKDFEQGLKKSERDLKTFGDRITNIGQRLTVGLSLPLALASGAAIKLGMDTVESENLFSVSMGKMKDSARAWSEDLRQQLGLNSYELRKNVGVFYNMLGSMGLGEKAAYELSTSLTKLSYDMASFFNISQQDAFQKIQSGITGEIEPLRRLGIIVNETTTKNWALTNGLIKQGETLSEAGKVMARYGVIMDATKNAQGDLARTLDSPANKLRILQEQLKQAWTELGVAFLPAASSFLSALKPVVENIAKLADWFGKLDPSIRNTIALFTSLMIALGPALIGWGKLNLMLSAFPGLVTASRLGLAGLSKAFGPFLVGGVIIAGLTAIIGLLAGMNYYLEEAKRIANEMPSVNVSDKSDKDLKQMQTRFQTLINNAKSRVSSAKQDYESAAFNNRSKAERQSAYNAYMNAQTDLKMWQSNYDQVTTELNRRSLLEKKFNATLEEGLTQTEKVVKKIGGAATGRNALSIDAATKAGLPTNQIGAALKESSLDFEEVINTLPPIFGEGAEKLRTALSALDNIKSLGAGGLTGLGGFLGVLQIFFSGIMEKQAKEQQKAAEKWQRLLSGGDISAQLNKYNDFSSKIAKMQSLVNNASWWDHFFGNVSHWHDIISQLQSSQGELFTAISKGLNTTAQNFSSIIAQAFDAADLTTFKQDVKEGIYTNVLQGLQTAFLQGAVMKPLFDELSQFVTLAVADGILSSEEFAAIQTMVTGIIDESSPFYEILQQLSDSMGILDNTVNKVNESMQNVPQFFKVALTRNQIALPVNDGGSLSGGGSRNIIINGDVYGYDDFNRKVNQAVSINQMGSGLTQNGIARA